MLYLAAIDKGSFRRATIQLLAKKVSERSWVAVSEDAIPIEDSGKFNSGTLVLAEINSNQQVERMREASKEIVGALQGFSRILEQTKGQDDEIEQWKQSLTFQSQELNRREVELETREEELQQLAEEYQQYESALKSLEAQRTEVETLERNLNEQQQAMGEQRRQLNEQQQELSQRLEEINQSSASSSRLDEAATERLKALSHNISQTLQFDPEALSEEVQALKMQLGEKIKALDGSVAAVVPDKEHAQRNQQQLNTDFEQWVQNHREWLKLQTSIAASQGEVGTLEKVVAATDSRLNTVNEQLQKQEEALRFSRQLLERSDVIVAEGVETSSAPQISPEELEAQLTSLRREYDQNSRLVEQQVTELTENHQKLEDLQSRLNGASADERFDIEMDIDYAKSACATLEESLAPQQRTLQKMQQQMAQKESLLSQLRGEPGAVPTIPTVDIGPLLNQLESHRQFIAAEKQTLEQQLSEQRSSLEQQRSSLEQQQQQADSLKQQLDDDRHSLWQRCQEVSNSLGQTTVKEQQLNEVKTLLVELQSQVEPLESKSEESQRAVAESRQHAEELQAEIAELLSDTTSSSTAEVFA